MRLTLGEVLRYDVLESAKILTKRHDLSREVKGISIMEAPDILNWMEGDEIILTSLYAVKDSEQKMGELVDSFYKKGLSALMVKTKRFFDQVPEEILKAAEELRFAVVEIPVSIRFTDIMYPVMAAIFDSQVIKLSYFKKTRNLLTGLALKNAGIKGIAEAFQDIVKNPVLIYDKDRVLLFSTLEGTPFIARTQVELTSLDDGEEDSFLYSPSQAEEVEELLDSNGTSPKRSLMKEYLLPIKILHYTTGYLGVLELNHPLNELDIIAMENAATVFSLEMLKDFTVSEVERNYKLELIEDILSGKNSPHLLERAKSLNWNLNKKYAVCVINFASDTSDADLLYSQISMGSSFNSISSVIRIAMQRNDLSGIAEAKKYMAVVFLEQPASSHRTQEKLDAFFQELIQDLSGLSQVESVNLGYSSNFCSISDIPASYQNAQHALKIGRILHGANSICDFERLGIFKLLCLADNKEELVALIPKALQRLLDYDEKNGAELAATLEAFFTENRNTSKAAAALFIHPKTMAYRLNKIQDLTGVDLKNSQDMLEMEMGLQMLKILKVGI